MKLGFTSSIRYRGICKYSGKGRKHSVGNSFRNFLSTLGQLLLSFKEMVREGFCWFPRLMRWNTSKGEVAPVFRDDPGGYNYKLEAFRNIKTKDIYQVENLKEKICSDNRIGTLEQIQGSVDYKPCISGLFKLSNG